jgi:outer membrane protein assembly factor BamB
MVERRPRHTKIEKEIVTALGVVVLEHPVGYVRDESNLYCVSNDGKILWFAELPEQNILYTRVRFDDLGEKLLTYSVRGHACEIDPKTGKLLSKISIS